MKKLFFGSPIVHTIDSKHRVNVPYRFRRVLGSNIIYADYMEKYLIRCYPEQTFQREKRDMLKKPKDDENRQIFF